MTRFGKNFNTMKALLSTISETSGAHRCKHAVNFVSEFPVLESKF